MRSQLFLLLAFVSVLLLGCLHVPSVGEVTFDTYENQEGRVSFEKPASWNRIQDPQAVVRFGDSEKTSFAFVLTPSLSPDFDKVVIQVFENFRQNPGLFNLQQRGAAVAGFQAARISSDQTTTDQQVVTTDLFIVKDTLNNRVLYFVFAARKDNVLSVRGIEQRILTSIKIY